jgi:hypothetical protein
MRSKMTGGVYRTGGCGKADFVASLLFFATIVLACVLGEVAEQQGSKQPAFVIGIPISNSR